MGIETYMEAFLFSLESMATVGYGTQDIFFDDCVLPMLVLTAQMLIRIVCDAGTIGIIYARLASLPLEQVPSYSAIMPLSAVFVVSSILCFSSAN